MNECYRLMITTVKDSESVCSPDQLKAIMILILLIERFDLIIANYQFDVNIIVLGFSLRSLIDSQNFPLFVEKDLSYRQSI